jgi:hypothetical protein
MSAKHRLARPWPVEELESCFVVRDWDGRPLTYVYYEKEGKPGLAANVLTRDEARVIAANVAKLPKLLSHASGRSAVICPLRPAPLRSQIPRAP